jgi:hypothetical protein
MNEQHPDEHDSQARANTAGHAHRDLLQREKNRQQRDMSRAGAAATAPVVLAPIRTSPRSRRNPAAG